MEGNEKLVVDQRAVERQATTQLTTLTSLLSGFAFLWFTTLVDRKHSDVLSLIILVETVLTILVLLLASIMGALLTIASEFRIREGALKKAEEVWGLLTKFGILLFLATVALLPYRVSLRVGVVCSVLVGVTAIAVVVVWGWIKKSAAER
jgi:hypothetical protein